MRSECILLQFGIEEGRVELDKRAIVQREPEADPLYRCSDASKRGVGKGFLHCTMFTCLNCKPSSHIFFPLAGLGNIF